MLYAVICFVNVDVFSVGAGVRCFLIVHVEDTIDHPLFLLN